MTRPLRYAWLWLLAGWILTLGAVLASLWPAGALRGLGAYDKAGHLAAYFVLMAWFSGIYPRPRYPLIAALLLALGIALEVVQGQFLHRTTEAVDVLANGLGIALAWTAALIGLDTWCTRLESWGQNKNTVSNSMK